MASARNHGIGTIGVALLNVARMNMNVGNHGQPATCTQGPQRVKVASVEPYDARVETIRVKVVVEDKVDDACATFMSMAEKKSAAFAAGVAAALAQASQ